MKRVVLLILVLFVQVCSAEVAYEVTDLGTFGESYSTATDINNNGQIVVTGEYGSFLWENGTMTDIGMSTPWRINNLGQVVGGEGSMSGSAFLWEKEAGLTALWVGGEARGINDYGQVAGHKDSQTVIWDEDNGVQQIPGHQGNDINNNGTVLGRFPSSAYIWDSVNGLVNLKTLSGSSDAYAINDYGQVVGVAREAAENGAHAVLWESPDVMVNLGRLGGIQSQAKDINNNGLIVGFSTIDSGDYHAFLYKEEQMIDLNNTIDPAAGWTLNWANAINDNDLIVGYGMIGGESHAFLMTPVPEPASLSLLLLGGMAFLRKRRG